MKKTKKKKNTNINKKTREVAKKKHTCRTVHSLCMTQNEAESPKKRKNTKKERELACQLVLAVLAGVAVASDAVC